MKDPFEEQSGGLFQEEIFAVMGLCAHHRFFLHTNHPVLHVDFVEAILRDKVRYAMWMICVNDIFGRLHHWRSLPKDKEPQWPLANVQLIGSVRVALTVCAGTAN